MRDHAEQHQEDGHGHDDDVMADAARERNTLPRLAHSVEAGSQLVSISSGSASFKVPVLRFAKGPSKDLAFEGHTPICLASNQIGQCSFQRITWLRHSCSPDVTVLPLTNPAGSIVIFVIFYIGGKEKGGGIVVGLYTLSCGSVSINV